MRVKQVSSCFSPRCRLQIFAYPTNGGGFKYKTDVETFKKYGNNAFEFERYAKCYLESIQGADKRVEIPSE